jgi:hypothetical protein
MNIKKANKHLEPWTVQESIQFLNLYLDGVKQRDVNVVCDQIAATLERTFDAIKLRKQEVVSILSEGEYGLKREKWTPHMQEAITAVMKDREISKAKMLYWFE